MKLVGLIVASLIASSAASAGTGPALRLADDGPLRIVGVGFRDGERVTVRVAVRGSSPLVRTVIATSRGRVGVTIVGRKLAACNRLVVTAIGAFGARASLQRPIPATCGLLPQPGAPAPGPSVPPPRL